MARVLATSRGRVLETVDARVGFTGEIRRALAKIASGRLAAAAQVIGDRTIRVHAGRYLIVREPAPNHQPDNFDELIDYAEEQQSILRPGDSRSVACPLCHRLRRVVIDPSGNAVLT